MSVVRGTTVSVDTKGPYNWWEVSSPTYGDVTLREDRLKPYVYNDGDQVQWKQAGRTITGTIVYNNGSGTYKVAMDNGAGNLYLHGSDLDPKEVVEPPPGPRYTLRDTIAPPPRAYTTCAVCGIHTYVGESKERHLSACRYHPSQVAKREFKTSRFFSTGQTVKGSFSGRTGTLRKQITSATGLVHPEWEILMDDGGSVEVWNEGQFRTYKPPVPTPNQGFSRKAGEVVTWYDAGSRKNHVGVITRLAYSDWVIQCEDGRERTIPDGLLAKVSYQVGDRVKYIVEGTHGTIESDAGNDQWVVLEDTSTDDCRCVSTRSSSELLPSDRPRDFVPGVFMKGDKVWFTNKWDGSRSYDGVITSVGEPTSTGEAGYGVSYNDGGGMRPGVIVVSRLHHASEAKPGQGGAYPRPKGGKVVTATTELKGVRDIKITFPRKYTVCDVVCVQDNVSVILDVDPFSDYPYKVKETAEFLPKIPIKGSMARVASYGWYKEEALTPFTLQEGDTVQPKNVNYEYPVYIASVCAADGSVVDEDGNFWAAEDYTLVGCPCEPGEPCTYNWEKNQCGSDCYCKDEEECSYCDGGGCEEC